MQQKKAAEWIPLLQLCFQEKAICCPYDNQPNGFSSSPTIPPTPTKPSKYPATPTNTSANSSTRNEKNSFRFSSYKNTSARPDSWNNVLF